ncbi:alpha/beta hydrolase [Catenulispora yoronensis]|uniref:Alpha/beta hydrolase n=1 Tax=Catenulispora yoronensis TaxID=450799 RepID=A0ABP5H751_9ACTN
MLDPQIEAMRERRMRAATPQLYTLSLAEARAADLESIQAEAGDPEPVHDVSEHLLPLGDRKIAVRVYRPVAERPLPTLFYFFGGGWTLGSLDTSDAVCRSLANTAGCQVVAVGYRLAPEHRFPAAVEDCHDALTYVAAHADDFGVDPGRMAVGGDSAGGNLAAAVALMVRADGIAAPGEAVTLSGQILVYPNTDQLADDASLRDNDDPWLFNHRSVGWYRSHYLADEADAVDPLASPLRAPDLSGLPPALVITAEFDPLRDQGEAYAARLAEAGVEVDVTRYPGMVHGFFTMLDSVDAARGAIVQAAGMLRQWFATE